MNERPKGEVILIWLQVANSNTSLKAIFLGMEL